MLAGISEDFILEVFSFNQFRCGGQGSNLLFELKGSKIMFLGESVKIGPYFLFKVARFNEVGKVPAAFDIRVGDLKNRWDEGLVISSEYT